MDPVALSRPLSGALRDVDPEPIPPDGVHSVEEAFRERTARRTFAMTLVGGFGLLALILSVVGLYGLISYSVAREQREIGVRIALGAHRGDVVGRVLRRSLGLTAAGRARGSRRSRGTVASRRESALRRVRRRWSDLRALPRR